MPNAPISETGLLLPQGDKRAAFYHLTIQDFFAAQRLADVREDQLFDVFCERGGVPEWRSALSFVCGSLLARHGSPNRGVQLLSRLVESLDPWRERPASGPILKRAIVIGDCLQILLKRGARLKPELEENFQDFCIQAIEYEAPLRDRFELGLALGHVGDPRIVVDLRRPGLSCCPQFRPLKSRRDSDPTRGPQAPFTR